jgi:O-antigen ligase
MRLEMLTADRHIWFVGFTSNLALFAAAIAVGALCVAFGDGLHSFSLLVAAAAVLAVLLIYPEFALALYVVIGDVKGDERVASLFPMDLTLVLGTILLAGIILNFLRAKPVVELPSAYFLFIAFVTLMAMSLTYTPVFSAGLEKLERFVTLTGIVIVAPFFVLGTPRAMKRFLIAFGAAAFTICCYSLLDLGGTERLATPSDNTIGLGHLACALILLIWFAVLPRYRFPLRMLVYPLLAVPTVALIGSGSRGSAIACAVAILISLIFTRRYLLDLALFATIGLVVLPFLHIPKSSFEYLGTLISNGGVSALLSFRGDLLNYGWTLLQQHPLTGVGLQGFRYLSPNVALYNWPHNIFLEVACELGIPAALIVFALFAVTIRESLRQLKDSQSPLFHLSQLAAALLLIGVVNATNTGDINSDRSTWLFVSLVFVVRGYRVQRAHHQRVPIDLEFATPSLRGSYP